MAQMVVNEDFADIHSEGSLDSALNLEKMRRLLSGVQSSK